LHNQIQSRLENGAKALDLELTGQQLAAMIEYLELLLKWNKVYNLTAVKDRNEMVVRHLLDSLAIAPWCSGRRFIDVGTGAGLPGVPLAILQPEKEFHLLDSNSKKTRFLFQVKIALGLKNMAVHRARVETFKPPEPYDAVLSRAFASLPDMVAACRHLLSETGQLLAMKGNLSKAELASVDGFCRTAVHKLTVPGLDEQRHLVILSGINCG